MTAHKRIKRRKTGLSRKKRLRLRGRTRRRRRDGGRRKKDGSSAVDPSWVGLGWVGLGWNSQLAAQSSQTAARSETARGDVRVHSTREDSLRGQDSLTLTGRAEIKKGKQEIPQVQIKKNKLDFGLDTNKVFHIVGIHQYYRFR